MRLGKYSIIQSCFETPRDIREITKNLFCCFKTSMLTDGFFTDIVHMEKGVLQGDCCSPLKETRN